MKQVWVAGLVRTVWSGLIVVGALAFQRDADASPSYGYTLISAGYTRGCAACHDDNAAAGGAGTANKPFAKTVKALGLTGDNQHDVFLDILNYQLEDHDTDCDGVIDVDELKNDGDVNDPSVVPNGFTAMVVANCNGEADTTSTADSTNVTGATSSGSNDDFDDSSESESGCSLVARSGNDAMPVFASLAVLSIVVARRRASSRRAG